MRGRPSSVLGSRHVKTLERKKLYEYMTNLYGWSLSHFLPTGVFQENEFTKANE